MSGLPHNLHIEIADAPYYHLSMNNGTLYVTQEWKHARSIMNFGKSDFITGPHLRETTEIP